LTNPATTNTVDATSLTNQWMPFTPNIDFKKDPRMFVSAKGKYFYSPSGAKILDGCSALFTTPAGHARVEIAEAVRQQILDLDYTSSFMRGHEKSFQLADNLVALLPEKLNKLFFVNSGSESIDTALKICLLYHRVRKEASRSIFVSRERAYHGCNLSGVALAGLPNNRRAFGVPALSVVHMRHTWSEDGRFVRGQPSVGAELAGDLLRFVQLHGSENIAACIVEPIAGSTGVLVPPIGYLERLREICTEHGILLIFDEVICGFGRTGKAFAAQTFEVTPDLITMAKAITNGVIPMGAVAVREDIYDTIMEISGGRSSVEFAHGYTASANPISCAAALQTLAIYQRENLFAKAEELSSYFLDQMFGLISTPGLSDIRGYGMLAGIDIDPSASGMDGYGFQKRCYDHGLHLKITGNSAIVAPPFICTRDDIDSIVNVVRTVLSTSS
jgi:beta-alanine--pyruvate transaminase